MDGAHTSLDNTIQLAFIMRLDKTQSHSYSKEALHLYEMIRYVRFMYVCDLRESGVHPLLMTCTHNFLGLHLCV